MIKHEIARLVEQAARTAQERGQVPLVAFSEVVVERPARPEHGDYAVNLPLRLGRAARVDPLRVAEAIAAALSPHDALAEVAAAPPGFLNFRLDDAWVARQVETILEAGERFGDVPLGGGRKLQVEFVSANPTGPLHVGNGRGAVIGSTLAAVLQAAGYTVEREYYVNDAGSQTEVFGRTLYARYLQAQGRNVPLPEDSYPGQYMVELAAAIVAQRGDVFAGPPDAPPPEALVLEGVNRMLESIEADMGRLGVRYDVWVRERSLYSDGTWERVAGLLRERGYLADKEGAVWFTSSALGEEKDNVVIRSDGTPTYFASDIAYHYNKFLQRRFDRVVDIWGADHQGHVRRMKAAVAALGVDPDALDTLIYQLVTLRRGGEQVRLSKRAGEIVTVRDLVEEVGPDACRFFFLARSADAQMDFDLELAKQQSVENPVYYVQYAHARIASILDYARERIPDYADGDVGALTHPREQELLRKMLQLPEVVEVVALKLAPHHLPHFALELATAFHAFYTDCRVVSEDLALSKARLKLVAAAKAVLARTLRLMGMQAPDQM